MSRFLTRKPASTQATLVEGKMRAGTPVLLNVGCGTDYKEGWINIDNNSESNIEQLDLNWDLRNPLPFADDSVDFIFNEHLFEHLTVEEGRVVIADLLRVLKPAGVLRIAMPDLAHTVHAYINIPLDEDPTIKDCGLEFVQTRAERMNMAFRWWGHKWLYDWEELEAQLLKDSGCSRFRRCEFGASDHAELRGLETRAASLLIAEVTK